MMNDHTSHRPELVRGLVCHAHSELVRSRAEIDAASRMLQCAHVTAGSTVEAYRDGDLFPALVLASDAVREALGQIDRFLTMQTAVLRDPIDTLAGLDAERGTPSRYTPTSM